jgi:hypothetical protein
MPDGRVDIDRLAGIIEDLAEQLAVARDALVELSAEARRPAERPADPDGHAAPWRPERIGPDPQLGDDDAPPESAPPAGTVVPRAQVASLQGVPLLSAGLVESVIGPIADLPELDAIEARIGRFHGVEAVTVRRLEGSDALLLIALEHPVPLADMLREDLGRPVASCRLAEGRIVVELAPE